MLKGMVVVGVVGAGAVGSPPAFTDVTFEAGLYVTYGCEEAGPLLLQMGGGGAVGDFDGDGWRDLFVVAGGSGPDRLYMNNGDGTFTDRAAAWGVAVEHLGIGASAGDYDGDGLVDLYVTSLGTAEATGPGVHRLYRNTGSGFVDVAASAGVAFSSPTLADGFGSCFGDWDLDGDLDLVVCGWDDAIEGTRLYENRGDGTFLDVTEVASTLDETAVFGFSPRIVDMDGDRWPELLIAADFKTSRYFVNAGMESGHVSFVDVTDEAGVGFETNGMGQTVGDVDNDGLVDWYVTSIFSGDGNGNFLYRNLGGHAYEAQIGAGVTDGGWGWGTAVIDANHDGWLDLAETNGWAAGFTNEPSYLFVNDGDGSSFTDMGVASGLVHTDLGRGLAPIDYDNDGDLDVVIFTNCGALRLFRNDNAEARLRVVLDTIAESRLAPRGRGSVVRATAGGLTQTRTVDGGCHYVCTGELSAQFGLGGAAAFDEVRVEWANGRVTVLTDVGASAALVVSYCPADYSGDGVLNVLDFVAFQTMWQAQDPAADCDGNGVFNVLDFVCFQQVFVAGCG